VYRSRLLVCADRVLLDASTNNVSIVEVMDELHGTTFPRVLPRLQIYCAIERDDSDSPSPAGRLLVTNNGTELGTFTIRSEFGDLLAARCFINFSGFVVS